MCRALRQKELGGFEKLKGVGWDKWNKAVRGHRGWLCEGQYIVSKVNFGPHGHLAISGDIFSCHNWLRVGG